MSIGIILLCLAGWLLSGFGILLGVYYFAKYIGGDPPLLKNEKVMVATAMLNGPFSLVVVILAIVMTYIKEKDEITGSEQRNTKVNLPSANNTSGIQGKCKSKHLRSKG